MLNLSLSGHDPTRTYTTEIPPCTRLFATVVVVAFLSVEHRLPRP